jgi:hypothetical protein
MLQIMQDPEDQVVTERLSGGGVRSDLGDLDEVPFWWIREFISLPIALHIYPDKYSQWISNPWRPPEKISCRDVFAYHNLLLARI